MRRITRDLGRNSALCGQRKLQRLFRSKFLTADSFEVDGPTVQWYDIHPKLRKANADILLLLDCYYAAQAIRARDNHGNKIEVLAAASMEDRTKKPGMGSFTEAFMLGCTEILKEKPEVIVSELHE